MKERILDLSKMISKGLLICVLLVFYGTYLTINRYGMGLYGMLSLIISLQAVVILVQDYLYNRQKQISEGYFLLVESYEDMVKEYKTLLERVRDGQ